MALMLYNSLTGRLEELSTRREGEVQMYTCGPTVHDSAHLGNFRTFVFQDLLRRWLEYSGFKVKQVMNLTDVDEKTIERAKRKGVSLKELTEGYIAAFFHDLDALNIERVEFYPKVSDNIPQLVEMVLALLEKGYAFKDEKDHSIYFDVNKFENYGKLSHMDVKETLRAKSRREDYADARHFVLWKAWDEMDGDVFWETELGKGRPGWHVECGALATAYLGCAIDIHSGGEDLVFPHHENSIAIAESANGCKFANYWVHTKHLLINGEKMSKSLRNYHTLQEFIEKGHDPMGLRLELMQRHYRKSLDFSPDDLEKVPEYLARMRNTVKALEGNVSNSASRGSDAGEAASKEITGMCNWLVQGFALAMDNDLDIETALLIFLDYLDRVNAALKGGMPAEDAAHCLETIRKLDTVLGLRL